ncbi:hypothetical protein QJS10_CPA08g00756 [Acorus calamus]|uniref:Uncharacterized protein n=1 Tax=Acorus calamus TaxID=4465 RepID=A0AAV9EAT4_ACOCL|nr:hypothetical protein QJS10_CPA08g00756 [Acorus calamus]
MRHSSNIGWDPNTKKFTAEPEVWEEFFKINTPIREIRSHNLNNRGLFFNNAVLDKSAPGPQRAVTSPPGWQIWDINNCPTLPVHPVWVPSYAAFPGLPFHLSVIALCYAAKVRFRLKEILKFYQLKPSPRGDGSYYLARRLNVPPLILDVEDTFSGEGLECPSDGELRLEDITKALAFHRLARGCLLLA